MSQIPAKKTSNQEILQRSALVLRSVPAMEGKNVVGYLISIVKAPSGGVKADFEGLAFRYNNDHADAFKVDENRIAFYLSRPGGILAIPPLVHEKLVRLVADYNKKNMVAQAMEISEDTILLA